MHVRYFNREIFDLPEDHLAHRFLLAFIKCRCDCIGLEASDNPIDQEWFSQTDGKVWLYSSFAYQYLAFDIILDAWLSHASGRTIGEERWLSLFPRWRALMFECKNAAEGDNNHAMVSIVEQVLEMLNLWEQSIVARDTATDSDYPHCTRKNFYGSPPSLKKRRK
jgi:hypothetical protein